MTARFDGWSQQLRGTLISVAGVLTLSPDTLLIRLVGSVDDWTVQFYRYFLQGSTMLVIFLVLEREKAPAKLWGIGRIGVLAGVIWGASNLLFTAAVQNTAVANVLVIVAGGDITFSALLSYLLLGERVPTHTIVCCCACFAAILLTFSDQLLGGGQGLLGNLCAMFASLTMAAYFVALRYASFVQGEAPGMIATNVIAGLLVGLVALCFGARPHSVAPDLTCLFLIIQGCIVLPLSFGLLTIGPTLIPTPEVSMIMLIETVLGPVWVFLGGFEAPPANTVWGGIILVVSLVAHSIASTRIENQKTLLLLRAATDAEAQAEKAESESEDVALTWLDCVIVSVSIIVGVCLLVSPAQLLARIAQP